MKLALGLEKDNGLIQTALTLGIHAFDTARAYGTEETLKNLPDYCKIVTKVKKGMDVLPSFEASKACIGRPIYALLMHDVSNYTPQAQFQLDFLKCNKEISKYGVSVYTPDQVPELKFDAIQFPLSLLNQNFLPLINTWKAAGVETWARSIFHKGILLRDPNTLPPYFDPIQRKLRALPKNPIARLSLCLNFIRNSGVDYCILGFKDRSELALAVNCLSDLSFDELASKDCIDTRMFNG